jgi:hypothetical protein
MFISFLAIISGQFFLAGYYHNSSSFDINIYLFILSAAVLIISTLLPPVRLTYLGPYVYKIVVRNDQYAKELQALNKSVYVSDNQ